MDCLSKTYQFYKLFLAFWLILDIIFHIIQTEQYFVLSPALNYYHEANLNLSERMSEFCTQINQTRFDKSLMNKEQNKIYEEWIDKCGYNDFMAKWPLRKDFLMVSIQFFEDGYHFYFWLVIKKNRIKISNN